MDFKYDETIQELARQNEKITAMTRWFEVKGNLYMSREDYYVLTGIKVGEKKEAHDGDAV